MKKLILILIPALFSCGEAAENEKTEVPQKNNYTLLFMDKTSSVHVDEPFVAQKYQAVIKDLVEQNIRQKGDQLDIYFVHENTAKGKSLSLVSRTEKEESPGMNATDLEAANTSYNFSLKKEQNVFIRQAVARLNQKNTGSSNSETNLTASIPIMNAAAETGSNIKAYFFSDMVESLKNGRDFHSNPPKSSTQAQEWANADLTSYGDANLSGVDIFLILPFEATASSKTNNPYVTEYWQLLLEGLGANVSEE